MSQHCKKTISLTMTDSVHQQQHEPVNCWYNKKGYITCPIQFGSEIGSSIIFLKRSCPSGDYSHKGTLKTSSNKHTPTKIECMDPDNTPALEIKNNYNLNCFANNPNGKDLNFNLTLKS
jgi:hypothetical protein